MNIFGKHFRIILVFIICMTLTGCVGSDFKSKYVDYLQLYKDTTAFIDAVDPLASVGKMDIDAFSLNCNKLNNLVTHMEKVAKSKDEKGLLGNVIHWTDSLNKLIAAHTNFTQLTIEEKQQLYMIFTEIDSVKTKTTIFD